MKSNQEQWLVVASIALQDSILFQILVGWGVLNPPLNPLYPPMFSTYAVVVLATAFAGCQVIIIAVVVATDALFVTHYSETEAI